MTVKPARTRYEKEKEEERIRYLRREQEEQEARRSLQDYLRHVREDEDDEWRDNAPVNPF